MRVLKLTYFSFNESGNNSSISFTGIPFLDLTFISQLQHKI